MGQTERNKNIDKRDKNIGEIKQAKEKQQAAVNKKE